MPVKSALLEKVNQITLADGGCLEAVGRIEPDIRAARCAAQAEAGKSINLNTAAALQPLGSREDNKPVFLFDAGRASLPNVPLMYVHRSILCLTLLIAFSNASRSGSGSR